MKGYIFEYYKYIRYSEESLESIKEILPVSEAEQSILTFGEYDRLRINMITEFERYRDMSSLAKSWVGNRQSILLYEIGDHSDITFSLKSGFPQFFWNSEKIQDNHLFWALTEFPFQNYLRNTEKGCEQLMKEAVKLIRIIVDTYNSKAEDQVKSLTFGSLGTFGICVLWFSDQYTN